MQAKDRGVVGPRFRAAFGQFVFFEALCKVADCRRGSFRFQLGKRITAGIDAASEFGCLIACSSGSPRRRRSDRDPPLASTRIAIVQKASPGAAGSHAEAKPGRMIEAFAVWSIPAKRRG